MSNNCPVCSGIGRVLAFGVCRDPIPIVCPECAGLAITPASADDELRLYTAEEVTAFLLGRWPALPPAEGVRGSTTGAVLPDLIEPVDELPEPAV